MISNNNETSQILEESEKFITFTVDNVEINKTAPSNLVTAQQLLDEIFEGKPKYEDCSHREIKEATYFSGRIQGFIFALHTAYQEHYPLKLSVSDFIILIGQGLGRHMEKHAHELRKYFVDHEEKEEIVIRRDEFVMGKQNDWSTVFEEFGEEIKKRTKTDFHSIIVDDTSVATKESRIVSEIALMDAMKAYFSYCTMTKCGIPQITLEGSKEDWMKLLEKVQRLQEMNKDDCLKLNFWLDHLVPTVEKICETAIERKPNVEFWSQIYKFKDGSGTPSISGWCTKLLPYLPQRVNNFKHSISTMEIVNQISSVPFVWDYYGELFEMRFTGGFLGAKFNQSTGYVEPSHFWSVTYDQTRKNF